MSVQRIEKPEVLSHKPIVFETAVSSGGSFPGLGHGVDGKPSKKEGNFPGGGDTGGQFPGAPDGNRGLDQKNREHGR